MSLIIYLALVAAAVVALRHGPGQALVRVYLPVLLLIPDSYHAITPGLPDPTFGQAAMVPILAVTLMRHGARWRPVFMDLLVLGFAAVVGYSDYSNRGYADAQNLMFTMLFAVVAPYLSARLVIGHENLHVAVARRFVFCVFIFGLLGFYEAKFGMNPFHAVLGRFFGGQGNGWVTTFRHGLARVAGPFMHAILAGIMVVVAYRLQRWLQWGGHWEPRFKRVNLPWDKAKVITVVLFLTALMTVARGPWIGGIVAAAIVAVGRAKDRRKALRIALAVLLLGALAGAQLLSAYLDIKPGAVMTMSQESAMYRKVLFEKYLNIALDHVWLGWGLTTWPKVPGMESIDNYYLLLSLMHGVPATLMLVAMLLGGAAQCIRRGLQEPPELHSPLFTFAGIYVAVFVSLGTVYMGEQVVPMVFFMLGWAQSWMQSPRPAAVAGGGAAPPPPPKPRFRHVIS